MSKHVEQAKEWLKDAPVEYRNGNAKRASLCVGMAQVEATLALAEQQRIANLIALAGLPTILGNTVSVYADHLRDWALTRLAEYRYTPPDYEEIAVLPEIAQALGVES